tara:strand:- start:523 stop:735 length:213 start_codon:yes stop_codon:yes gene_type:complete
MMSVDGSNIVRVSDEQASKLYEEGFRYVSKSLWKEKVRDIKETTDKKPKGNTKSNKLSKAQKRHLRKSKK